MNKDVFLSNIRSFPLPDCNEIYVLLQDRVFSYLTDYENLLFYTLKKVDFSSDYYVNSNESRSTGILKIFPHQSYSNRKPLQIPVVLTEGYVLFQSPQDGKDFQNVSLNLPFRYCL